MPSAEEISLANKAIRNGLITIDDAKDCFGFQAQQQKTLGSAPALCDILVERGYLSRAQIELLQRTPAPHDPNPPLVLAPAKTPTPPAAPAPEPPPPTSDSAVEMQPIEEPLPDDDVVEMTPIDSKANLPSVQNAPAKPPPRPAAPPPAAAKPAGPPNPKEPIPGYQIVGKIGAGGMATVFKAVRNASGETCALKILFPHHAKNALFLRRFHREAQLLTEFQHENIVRGIEYGTANGLHFLVMEFLEGESLQAVIDRLGSLTEEQCVAITLQIAKGLEYIEGQGIVHRDIKPDNLIITPSGTLKMIDLGFAKPIGQAEDTGEDMTCGTAQYMSPEQAQGARDVDVRSDIYALGATLYHMALGDVPFKGTDNMEVMAAQVLQDLKASDVKSGKISRQMHYFLEKLMAKEVDVRYQNPAEVIEDLESVIEGLRSLEFNPEEAVKPPDLLEGSRPAKAPSTDKTPAVRAPGKDSGSAFKTKGGSGLHRKSRLDELRKKAGDKDGQSGSGFSFWKKK